MTPIHQSSTPSVLIEKYLLEQNHKICYLVGQYHYYHFIPVLFRFRNQIRIAKIKT